MTETGDDLDDEEELAKLIKEEDINMMPENTDVSEIDKLTGMPKPNGKGIAQSSIQTCLILAFCRLFAVRNSYAGALHND